MKIFGAKEYGVKLKASVHKTGRLGFDAATAQWLAITKDTNFKFGEEEDGSRYLIITKEDDGDTFKPMLAAGYYSLDVKTIMNVWQVPYAQETIIFDLVDVTNRYAELGKTVLQMKMRAVTKRTKGE